MPTAIVHRISGDDLQMMRRKIKGQRLLKFQEFYEHYELNAEFLERVVTKGWLWIFEYDPESKRQNSNWYTKEPPLLEKAKTSKWRLKTMLIVFFDKKCYS